MIKRLQDCALSHRLVHTLAMLIFLNRETCRCSAGRSGQSSSERVRYFAERVLNVRSDQKIKNAFGKRSFRFISCLM